jgi:hypothetical protein
LEQKAGEPGLAPLDWGTGRVRIEFAFRGEVRRFEIAGSFFRLGGDPRCECHIPNIPLPVAAYVQIAQGYLVVLEMNDLPTAHPADPLFVLAGGTVWLQPNARLTLLDIDSSPQESEQFSWESFDLDDIKVFPNTLVIRSGMIGTGSEPNHFRLVNPLSILGTAPGCHLRISNRNVSKFQAVVFRGEAQGQPPRVVDLFAGQTTLIDQKPANGQSLDVGSELTIGGLRLESVRFLYNASRPDQLIEINHSFLTLPLRSPNQPSSLSAPAPATTRIDTVTSKPETSTKTGKANSSKSASTPATKSTAIGFDPPATQKPSIHFQILTSNDSLTSTSITPSGSTMPAISSPPNVPATIPSPPPEKTIGSIEALEAIQQNLSEQLKSLTQRLEGIEEAIEHLPTALQENSDQLMQAVNRLCESVSTRLATFNSPTTAASPTVSSPVVAPSKTASTSVPVAKQQTPAPTQTAPSVVSKPTPTAPSPTLSPSLPAPTLASAPSAASAPTSQLPTAREATGLKLGAPKQAHATDKNSSSHANTNSKNKKKPERGGPERTKADPPKPGNANTADSASETSDKSPQSNLLHRVKSIGAYVTSKLSRNRNDADATEAPAANATSIPLPPLTLPQKRKAEKDFVGESVLVSSNLTTSKRSRLQTDPNSAEILASHESKEETQVLGSLMGLRYRDAHASFLRWSIIGIVFLVTLLAGGPLVWYRIPQGWRELIWQKISFTQPDSTTSLSTEPNTNPGSSTPAKPPDSTTTSPTPAETPTLNELSTKESL